MRRTIVVVLCLLMAAACGGGQNGTSQSTTPKNGGSATIALENELRTLDPLDSSLLVEREVFYNMYDSLFTIDPKLVIKPGLVKQWDVADPVTYKFTLQSGVKFHDGTPFDAQSVKDNVTRYKTAANSRRKSDLASVDTVEVVDSTHVTFHLKKADATLLATLVDRAEMMLSMAALKAGGQNFSLSPVGAGSGPFQFVEWKRNDHLTLKKNATYWKPGLPHLDGLTYRAIPDVNAILAALKTGDIDVARTISSKDVAGLKADSNFVYRDMPALGCNVNWSGRVDPDGNMYAWWHTGGDFNDSVYSNAQVDGWLDDARTTTDQTKRKQDYDNAQKQIVTDAPYVFSFFGTSAQISDNKIHDFTLYPDLMIRMAEVWKG